jgi:hypothetical protein
MSSLFMGPLSKSLFVRLPTFSTPFTSCTAHKRSHCQCISAPSEICRLERAAVACACQKCDHMLICHSQRVPQDLKKFRIHMINVFRSLVTFSHMHAQCRHLKARMSSVTVPEGEYPADTMQDGSHLMQTSCKHAVRCFTAWASCQQI